MPRLLIVCVIAHLARGPSPCNGLDGKIVGGADTTIEEHPYQVSLEKNGAHNCGGSLIRPNVVLSAAHCTYGTNPSNLRIRAGSTTRERGGQVAQVVRICHHPKYMSRPGSDYDVSVLALNRSLPLGIRIRTIPLQRRSVALPVGTVGSVTGWGLLGNGRLPTVLQVVEVPKVDQAACAKSYVGIGPITARMTCYGYSEGGRDSCAADSGGPLVTQGKQIGIVSFGTGCARPGYPGVYVDVSNAEVMDHIEKCITNFKNI